MRRAVVPLLVLLLNGPAARAEDLPYVATLEGVDDAGLKADIQLAARLFSLAARPPPGLIALRRRAEEDQDRIGEVLRSRGFYDGTVAVVVDEAARPVTVTVMVTPGPPTTLAAWSSEPDLGISVEQVGLRLGAPAVAAEVVKAEGKLLQLLAARAQPLAKVLDRRVVVEHARHEMTVVETLDPGPAARFAAPIVNGLTTIDPDWVRKRVPWRDGDPFDPAKVEGLRKSLANSGLFRTIRITTGKELDSSGRLPVSVDLAERAARSVGAGLLYSTAEGPGVQAFWEDRNLLDGAERLRLTGLVSRPRFLALADYRAPDTFGADRDLLGDVSYEQLRSSAFFTRTAAVSSGVEWRVTPIWSLSAAGALEHTIDIESGLSDRRFDLASLPLRARRDSTDDILDPTRGGRTTAQLRPYVEVTGEHRSFTRLELQQTAHFTLLDDPRVVLAGWGDVGTYLNSSRIDLPSDKRFYAGGGGSVRGYRLRFAGPLDVRGQPAGGRSLLGFGGELRVKIGDDFGVVPFIEGANVYPTTIPDLGQGLFLGTGLGLRYYTPLGPIRADVAVPLRRRPGIDDAYEIYLSLGQAF